jgi:hypothetical protein
MPRLKVLFEVEITGHTLVLSLDGRVTLLLVLLSAGHDTGLLVITDALLEEVGLAGQRDVLHEIEGVGGVVVLVVTQSQEQAVGDKLNVLAHEGGVHAEQRAGESICQELLLNLHCLGDDSQDGLLAGAVVEHGEEEAGKVGVHALITRDQLVGERETGHEATLLEPEDGCERSTEEDTLDGSKGDETVGKGRVLVRDPSQGPVGLPLDAGDCSELERWLSESKGCLTVVNGVEQVVALLGLANVCVDEQRVCLGVDVLHHDLEAVEAACLRDLYLAREALDEVLVDNAIGGSEESEDVGDEEALVVVQSLVPVVKVLGKIDLFGSPEGSLGLFVHLPDLKWIALVVINDARGNALNALE